MRCFTTNTQEIRRFLFSAFDWAKEEKECNAPDKCWCHHCRTGAGEMYPCPQTYESTNNYNDDEGFAFEKYHSGSGKGTWRLITEEDKNSFTKESEKLVFDGYRNSFRRGCEFFRPSKEGDWKLSESSVLADPFEVPKRRWFKDMKGNVYCNDREYYCSESEHSKELEWVGEFDILEKLANLSQPTQYKNINITSLKFPEKTNTINPNQMQLFGWIVEEEA